MENFDPMRDAYYDRTFNSYGRGGAVFPVSMNHNVHPGPWNVSTRPTGLQTHFIIVPTYNEATKIMEKFNQFQFPSTDENEALTLHLSIRYQRTSSIGTENGSYGRGGGSAPRRPDEFTGTLSSQDHPVRLIPPSANGVFTPINSSDTVAAVSAATLTDSTYSPSSSAGKISQSAVTHEKFDVPKAAVGRSKLLVAKLNANPPQVGRLSTCDNTDSNSRPQQHGVSSKSMNEGQKGSSNTVNLGGEAAGSTLGKARLPRHAEQQSPSTNREQTVSSADFLKCCVCERTTKSKCAFCKTPYCSRECQAKDWSQHRQACIPRTKDEQEMESQFDVNVSDEVLDSLQMQIFTNGDLTSFDDGASGMQNSIDSSGVKKDQRKQIAPCIIPLDQTVKVILTAPAHSPYDIFVNPCDIRQLRDLQQSLKMYYADACNLKPFDGVPAVGDFCVAPYNNDGSWYRARIESINPGGGMLRIFYVDFGNTDIVLLDVTFQLAYQFYELPSMVAHCKLHNVAPADGGSTWSEESKEQLQQILHESYERSTVHYSLVALSLKDQVYTVVLQDQQGQDISSKLVELGLACRTPLTNTATRSGRLATQRLVKDLPIKPPLYPTASKRLSAGKEILITITEIISPTQFWIQVISSDEYVQLDELQREMTKHYAPMLPTHGFTPTGSMLYACRLESSTSWYRVQAIDFDLVAVNILFLDFGCRMRVPLVSLHSLEGQFISLPFQAVCCSLAGVRSTSGNDGWTSESVDFFKELVSSSKRHVAYVNRTDSQRVHLEISTRDETGLASKMIRAGHAELNPGLSPNFFKVRFRKPVDEMSFIIFPSPLSDNAAVDNPAKQATTGPAAVNANAAHSSSNSMPLLENASVGPESVDRKRELLDKPQQSIDKKLVPVAEKSPKQSINKNFVPLAEKSHDSITSNMMPPSVFWANVEKISLNIGESYQVLVQNFEDPTCFYVMLCEKSSLRRATELHERLQQLYADNAYNKTACIEVGAVVVAKYSHDGCWYRAVIESITATESEEFVYIRFFDYCSEDKQPSNSLHGIDRSVIDGYPVQLTRCTFDNIADLTVVKPWNPELLSHIDTEFNITVTGVTSDGIYKVKMRSNANASINIEEELIKNGTFMTKEIKSDSDGVIPTRIEADGGDSYLVLIDKLKNLRNLNIGDTVEVVYKTSPGDFYVHVTKFKPEFLKLMNDLLAHCRSTAVYQPEYVGEMVAALYDDQIWYRVSITGPPSNNKIVVHFVDFGNTGDVSLDNIRTLPSGFDRIRPWAVPCSIHGIERMTADAKAKFGTEEFECKEYVVTGHCELADDKYEIDMLAIGEQQTVREKLLGGSSIGQATSGSHCKEKHSEEATKENLSRAVNTASPSESNNTAPTKVAYEKSPGNFNNHQTTQSMPLTTSVKSVLTSTSMASASLPQPGAEVVIVHANSPGDFYIQLAGEYSQKAIAPMLQDLQKASLSAIRVSSQLEKGSMVMARFDEAWYRAEVVQSDGDRVRVFFVDFGNEDNINLSDVRMLDKSFTGRLPKLAVNCCISGVIGVDHDGSWTLDAITWFNENCLGKSFTVVEASPSYHCEIDLRMIAGTVPVPDVIPTIKTSLLSMKYARPIQQFLLAPTPAPNESVPSSPSVLERVHMICEVANLPKNGTEVTIVYADSPSCFYVWIKDVIKNLATSKLLEEIHHFYSAYPSGTSVSDGYGTWTIGELVAVKYDNYWSRAEVKELQDKIPTVQFLDYGNIETVSDHNNIRKLEKKFASAFPRLAIKCRLVDVCGSGAMGEWMPNAVAHFKQMETRYFTINKVEVDNDTGICSVDLLESGVPLTDILISNGYALATVSNQRLPKTGENVQVVYVNNPTDFFVQLASIQDQQFVTLMQQLREYCPSAAHKNPVQVGEIVAAMFEGFWCRAQVMIPPTGDSVVMVRFIDYGNVCEVNISDIRALPKEFVCSTPSQAIHCMIHGIRSPHATTDKKNQWSQETVKWFKETFEWKDVTVVNVTESSDSVPISLDVKIPGATSSVRSEMLAKLLALDDSKVGVVMPLAEALTAGSTVNIVHVVTPGDFYTHLVKSNVASFATINHELSELFTSMSQATYQPSCIGVYVAARYDDLWYRARVKNLDDGQGQVTVEFVDFGNVDNVSPSDLRSLPEKFIIDIPCLAVHCRLAGVFGNGVGKIWCQESIDWFKNNCENASFVVHSIYAEKNSIFAVDLLFDKSGVSVSDEILSKNLGSKFLFCLGSNAATDGQAVPSFLPVLIPESGARVKVCAAVDPSQFYCFNIDAVQAIQGDLRRLANTVGSSATVPALMEYCIGYYNQEKEWHRVQVTQILGETVIVKRIDYGDAMPLPISDLRPIPKELMQMPPQAFFCKLSGAVPMRPGTWPILASNSFKALVDSSKSFFVNIVSREGPVYVVELTDYSGAAGSVTEQLVRERMAKVN